MNYFYSLISVAIVSLLSCFVIIFIHLSSKLREKLIKYLVYFAAGSLISDALLHLIPEAFESNDSAYISYFVIIGIFIFYILENVICWRHCHNEESKQHKHNLVIMNYIGDALHNLIDGFVIGVSFNASINLGISTTIAIILHEIPQEIGDYSILLHSGMKSKKAILINLSTSLTAFVGVFISYFIPIDILPYSLALTAGGFLYISIADLLPIVRHDPNKKRFIISLIFALMGIIVIGILR